MEAEALSPILCKDRKYAGRHAAISAAAHAVWGWNSFRLQIVFSPYLHQKVTIWGVSSVPTDAFAWRLLLKKGVTMKTLKRTRIAGHSAAINAQNTLRVTLRTARCVCLRGIKRRGMRDLLSAIKHSACVLHTTRNKTHFSFQRGFVFLIKQNTNDMRRRCVLPSHSE